MMPFPAARRRARRGGTFSLQRRWLLARSEQGAQLVEFAFLLPFLAVMTVGIIDFAQGFLLKQRLTNAAREGARIAAELSPIDIDQASPPTVRSVRNAVVNYLDNADLDVSSIGTTSCNTGPAEWTFYDNGDNCPGNSGDALIVIERAVVIPVTGAIGSRVTVRYPFTWSFSEVIDLIAPSASYPSSFLISTDVTMKNLVN
ncbi:MAG: pilus assembly protein [Acidobacteria bacterium]|nr:pilus assembly protein [Acidobacteriota bacterium]